MAQRHLAGRHQSVWAALLALLPLAAHAEAYGPADPLLAFVIGAIVGVPAAIGCVLVEVILPRRPVRGAVALAAALAAVVVLVLLSAATRPPFGGLAQFAFVFWAALPVLALLALRGAVPGTWMRLGAGWLLLIALLALLRPGAADHARSSFLIGATATCLVLWSVALLVLGVAGIRPPRATGPRLATFQFSPQLRDAAKHLCSAVIDEVREFAELLGPAKVGLYWWLGSATLIYVGFALAIAVGMLDAFWLYAGIARVLDILGRRMPAVSTPLGMWWLLGLPWSLLVSGAIWGLAGLFGAFDPGRLRGLRLASIVVGGVLIAWSASVFVATQEIRAAEEAAVSGRR